MVNIPGPDFPRMYGNDSLADGCVLVGFDMEIDPFGFFVIVTLDSP